jgi:radical SAM enzyme (rSAM/lipoprotein system)
LTETQINLPPISIKTRVGLELFRLYRAAQAHLHELNYLFWECTLRCNLNCMHCGSDCTRDSSIKDMPIADFLKVLDEVAREYNPNKIMIAVTGGEPLMRNDLEACGRQFYKRGFPWGMVSNGYLLDATRLSALTDAGLRSVTISLDGLQDSHDWLRNKKVSFSRAIHAISLCTKQEDLIFDVVTCVNQKNFSELSDIKKLLIDLGVRKWRLFTIFPKGRAKNIPELHLSDTEFRMLLDFIMACRSEETIGASYGCEGFLGNYEGRVRDGFFFCRAGITVASVLADGSISACPSLRGDYIQGNIHKDHFLHCWNTRYKIMRNRSWCKTIECSSCKVFKWCGGNGLHLRDENSKGLLMCHYKKLRNRK